MVSAPSAKVWDLIADPDHLPRWWPGVTRVEEVTPVAWTKVLKTPKGRLVRADYTRRESEPPTRLVWQQELIETPFERIMSEAMTEIELEAAGPDSTHVEMRALRKLRGLSRLGGFMVRRATRKQLDEALEGLERVVGRS